MARSRTVLIAVALLSTSLLAAPAGAVVSGAIAHPTGADDVIVRIVHSENGWGGVYSDAFNVTVYGDGRVVIVPPTAASTPPLPEATVLRVTEAGIQRLLRAARAAGLLRTTDYGQAGVTDQGTSRIEVAATGTTHTDDVYALLLPEADRGLTGAQRLHRRRLRTFVHRAADADFYGDTLVTI